MVTIVTPPAYDNPCAEVWVDPAALSTADPEVAERAALGATWALWSLTGERFHGDQCLVDDYRTIRGYCNIQLRHGPVTEVVAVSTIDVCGDAVTVTGVGDVISGWCNKGAGEIRVCCNSNDTYGTTSCGCNPNGSVVRVHYRIGNNLPPGADRAAFRLAEEYAKAAVGQPCNLPERITSVSRQGASWTILDPQDFLQDGLTGIGPVDSWLAQVGLRSRWMTMTDPLRSVPLSASTQVCFDSGDCFADII